VCVWPKPFLRASFRQLKQTSLVVCVLTIEKRIEPLELDPRSPNVSQKHSLADLTIVF
jgi:hypothetical protein